MSLVRLTYVCAVTAWLIGVPAQAGDWPQWRGPQRNGIASGGPAQAAAWPEDGPTKLWESERLPSGREGGYGSPVVAGGRVYLYVNEMYRVPVPTRMLSTVSLHRLGWGGDEVPPALAKAVEAARTSAERAKLTGRELRAWLEQWLETRPSEDDRKRHGSFLRQRLQEGPDAIPPETLRKLATIRDKEFPTEQALTAWLDEHGITGETRKRVLDRVPTDTERAKDVIICLGAADGRTVWKVEFPDAKRRNASSTVCIADGRLYGVLSTDEAVCLDAGTGLEVWKVKCRNTHSSFLCVGGMAIIAAGELTAFNAQTGAVVWTQKKVRANNNSASTWQVDGGVRLLCNTSRDVACVDLKSGDVLWTVPGGGPSTAAVAEGHMAVLTSKDDVGLIAYRLSATGAEKLWHIPGLTDRGASPIIHDGHVYAVAGRKAACVHLATGNIVWEGAPGRGDVCSPVVADGKLIAVLGGGRGMAMIEAAPGAYKLLASAKLSASACASPAIADGRLYVRMRESVACFDLARPATSAR